MAIFETVGCVMGKCLDHLEFKNEKCPECGLDVDEYGNTEDQLDNCCFPDCGCDGARLCMAGEASERAYRQNVEGMWSGRTKEQREAALSLYGDLIKDGTIK